MINRWIKRVGIGLFLCIGTVLVVIAILMVMAARFNGIWKMDAHGLCLKAHFGIVKAYAVTDSSDTRE